ncbi:MAG: ABC transporter permease [Rhodocyclales bacterium RIFCSPLOWO2_02_FULL_63_24]|nr:MAG: ABC transporter permease [Rhodocyclales bacterium GWA2_65_19]OHC71625.1 MAG: ABC transporter permease [Rhodocyclales bacterium RIFCSPLOWO2_02_FULL_63_24]
MNSAIFPRGRLLLWGGCLAAAIALPLLFKSGFVVSLLCQMGIMVVFALSYNMLLGQTGLLSFGHAVYYGLGAFVTMHALNIVGKDGGPLTTALLPLVGGLAGMLAGVLLGYVTTKKAGTTFAMISLGIGELVAASALMFPGFFGGEGGVSGNRVVGKENLLGLTWGPQVEMYGLIVAWAFLATVAMFALTQTPLGRMANAVRDNPERAEFVGYDTQRVRFLMVILSGLFAGIAGGLSALNYEIITAETLNAHTSGVVLLMTFVGGIGFFYGPIIGAILITVMQIVIGGLTHAWLLYFGLFFLFMVLMAPGGIASVIAVQRNLWLAGLLGRMLPHYLAVALPVLVLLAGLVGLVELSYALLAGEGVGAGDTATRVMTMEFHLNTPGPWLAALGTTALGLLLTRWIGSRAGVAWNAALATLHGDKA